MDEGWRYRLDMMMKSIGGTRLCGVEIVEGMDESRTLQSVESVEI